MQRSLVAVSSSLNPSIFGQPVTLTATLSPVPPGTATPTGRAVGRHIASNPTASERDRNQERSTTASGADLAGVRYGIHLTTTRALVCTVCDAAPFTRAWP